MKAANECHKCGRDLSRESCTPKPSECPIWFAAAEARKGALIRERRDRLRAAAYPKLVALLKETRHKSFSTESARQSWDIDRDVLLRDLGER